MFKPACETPNFLGELLSPSIKRISLVYRVLLVEDDAQIRRVIGDYFARRDKIALEFAVDGNEGLAKFLNGSFDLIVLDIMMPILSQSQWLEECNLLKWPTLEHEVESSSLK